MLLTAREQAVRVLLEAGPTSRNGKADFLARSRRCLGPGRWGVTVQSLELHCGSVARVAQAKASSRVLCARIIRARRVDQLHRKSRLARRLFGNPAVESLRHYFDRTCPATRMHAVRTTGVPRARSRRVASVPSGILRSRRKGPAASSDDAGGAGWSRSRIVCWDLHPIGRRSRRREAAWLGLRAARAPPQLEVFVSY